MPNKSKKATRVDLLQIVQYGRLPDGVHIVEVPCADHDAYLKLPKGLSFEDRTYGLSGWNSDRCVAYYRTDRLVARPL
jgi:hypothetical protein